jgi:ribonuclease HI
MKKVTIYTDGGARGNPGPAALGAAFYNEKGEVFKEYSEYLGDKMTNNEAEYEAVIFALKKFKQVFGSKIAKITEIELKSDSELLVSQLNGKYKVIKPEIQKLFLQLWNLKLDFKKVKFSRVPRARNKKADSLVNEALDKAAKSMKLF